MRSTASTAERKPRIPSSPLTPVLRIIPLGQKESHYRNIQIVEKEKTELYILCFRCSSSIIIIRMKPMKIKRSIYRSLSLQVLLRQCGHSFGANLERKRVSRVLSKSVSQRSIRMKTEKRKEQNVKKKNIIYCQSC